MKKVLVFALVLSMLTGLLAFGASATENYSIPEAATAPTIDGVINADEWNGALSIAVDSDSISWVLDAADSTIGAGSYISIMWDANALYFAANILDSTVSASNPAAGAALNAGDGIQVCFYSSDTAANGDGANNLFWDFLPWTGDGHDASTAESYEHFNLAGTTPNVTIASVIVGTGYTMEWAIPWSDFATIVSNGYEADYTAAAGTEMYLELCVLDTDGAASQSLGYTTDGWCDPSTNDLYTLVNTQAGIVAAAETEAPAEDTAAADTAAPTETTTETPAAQTADITAAAALVAVIALGAIVVSKKK